MLGNRLGAAIPLQQQEDEMKVAAGLANLRPAEQQEAAVIVRPVLAASRIVRVTSPVGVLVLYLPVAAVRQ